MIEQIEKVGQFFGLTWLIFAGLVTFVWSFTEIRNTHKNCVTCKLKKFMMMMPSDLLSHL